MKVQLGGVEYAAALPRRFAERRGLCSQWINNRLVGAAAIAGMCIPDLKVGYTLAMVEGNVYEYGSVVLEELVVKRGLSEVELVQVAAGLFTEIAAATFPSAAEVEKAEDF